MLRDIEKREQAAVDGAKGGNPEITGKRVNPSVNPGDKVELDPDPERDAAKKHSEHSGVLTKIEAPAADVTRPPECVRNATLREDARSPEKEKRKAPTADDLSLADTESYDLWPTASKEQHAKDVQLLAPIIANEGLGIVHRAVADVKDARNEYDDDGNKFVMADERAFFRSKIKAHTNEQRPTKPGNGGNEDAADTPDKPSSFDFEGESRRIAAEKAIEVSNG
jgi:hypothetical protein